MSLFKHKIIFSSIILLSINLSLSQVPQDFLIHRVKKDETLTQIIDFYGISEIQLNEYNPSLNKLGIKKRMLLRIPVYQKISPLDTKKQNKSVKSFETYIVKPKETKWRLAYEHGMTINELDSLNPKDISIENPKTKELLKLLEKTKFNSGLIIVNDLSSNLELAARNIPHIEVTDANFINPIKLLKHDAVLIAEGCLPKLEELFT